MKKIKTLLFASLMVLTMSMMTACGRNNDTANNDNSTTGTTNDAAATDSANNNGTAIQTWKVTQQGQTTPTWAAQQVLTTLSATTPQPETMTQTEPEMTQEATSIPLQMAI